MTGRFNRYRLNAPVGYRWPGFLVMAVICIVLAVI